MCEKVKEIVDCLSLDNNKSNDIPDHEKLYWAINELDNFPMTVEILENYRIAHLLQNVRRMNGISGDAADRIRSIIKCWRLLVSDDCLSVTPSQHKSGRIKKSTTDTNGFIKNGFLVKELDSKLNVNGVLAKIDNQNKENTILNVDFQVEIADVSIVGNTNENGGILSEETLLNSNHLVEVETANEKKDNCVDINTDVNKENEKQPEPTVNVTENEENISKVDVSIDSQPIVEPDNVLKNNEIGVTDVNSTAEQSNLSCLPVDIDVYEESNHSTTHSLFESKAADDSKQKELFNQPIGKPKVKSTKELLHEWSTFIEADTKAKILFDKIEQEEDDPQIPFDSSEQYNLREVISNPVPFDDVYGIKELMLKISNMEHAKKATVKPTPYCDILLEKFRKCGQVIESFDFMQMVGWKNLKRGIHVPDPSVVPRKIRRVHRESLDDYDDEEFRIKSKFPNNRYKSYKEKSPSKPITVDVISNLLHNFEVREERKRLVQDAMRKRKEAINPSNLSENNSQKIVEPPLKIKVKVSEPRIPKITLRKRRKKRRKKRRSIKVTAPKPPKVRKPRQPQVRPKPPITNRMNIWPDLPILTEDLFIVSSPLSTSQKLDLFATEQQQNFVNDPELIMQLAKRLINDVLPGYNCIRHCQSSENICLQDSYSILVDQEYLHVLPWTDMSYTNDCFGGDLSSAFPQFSDDILNSFSEFHRVF